MNSEDPSGLGWDERSGSARIKFEQPVAPIAEPPAKQGFLEAAPSAAPGLGGEERRFYAVASMIATPVFVAIFAIIARSALPNAAGRPIGVGATVLAVLFAVLFLRTPYAAIVSADGSITFKAPARTKVTSISRIYRMRLSTGARGASSWIFEFDGTSERLGDRGGRGLALYLANLNPSIDAPPRIRRIINNNFQGAPRDPRVSAPQTGAVTHNRRWFVAVLAVIAGLYVAAAIFFFVDHALPGGPEVQLATTQCTITAGGSQGFWTGTLVPLGNISRNSEVVVSWQVAGATLWYGEVDVTAPIPKGQATPLSVHVYAQTPTPASGVPSCSPEFKYDESPVPSGDK
jgi:hypothetical protein